MLAIVFSRRAVPAMMSFCASTTSRAVASQAAMEILSNECLIEAYVRADGGSTCASTGRPRGLARMGTAVGSRPIGRPVRAPTRASAPGVGWRPMRTENLPSDETNPAYQATMERLRARIRERNSRCTGEWQPLQFIPTGSCWPLEALCTYSLVRIDHIPELRLRLTPPPSRTRTSTLLWPAVLCGIQRRIRAHCSQRRDVAS